MKLIPAKYLSKMKSRRCKKGARKSIWQYILLIKERHISTNTLAVIFVEQKEVTTKQYSRDPYVSELAKRLANGKCELCGQMAPFKDGKGKP